jgi:hypothetical protein
MGDHMNTLILSSREFQQYIDVLQSLHTVDFMHLNQLLNVINIHTLCSYNGYKFEYKGRFYDGYLINVVLSSPETRNIPLIVELVLKYTPTHLLTKSNALLVARSTNIISNIELVKKYKNF